MKTLFKAKLFLNTSGCHFASAAVKSWWFLLLCTEAGVLIILLLLLHGAGCLVVIAVSMSGWWLADCELFHALMQPLASWIIRLMMLSEWESGKKLVHLGGLCVCSCVWVSEWSRNRPSSIRNKSLWCDVTLLSFFLFKNNLLKI